MKINIYKPNVLKPLFNYQKATFSDQNIYVLLIKNQTKSLMKYG